MEHIEEYSSVVNDFLTLLTTHSQVICAYQYFKDNISIGVVPSELEKLEEKTGKSINFIDLQGTIQESEENNVPRNTMEATSLVYLYIQELIEKHKNSHDPKMIFVGMRLKKYNCDILGQICTLNGNRIETFNIISDFLEKNHDFIEIFVVG